MPRRALDAGGVTIAIILGLLAGPILFYALAGDYWHSTNLTVSRGLAGGVGGVLALAALLNATRFHNAGLAGAVTGLAGAIGETVVAVVPWLGLTYRQPTCAPSQVCPLLAPAGVVQLALTVGIFTLVVFTLAGFSLASLVAALRQRFA